MHSGQCATVQFTYGTANTMCTMLPVQEGLWWLPLRRQQRDALRTLLLITSLAGAVAGLEGRLIWRAFGQYISAAVPSPWSYLIVTAAFYGAAALFLLHHAGEPLSVNLLPLTPISICVLRVFNGFSCIEVDLYMARTLHGLAEACR